MNRDRTESVTRNEDLSVGEERRRNVGKKEIVTIGEEQDITVSKDRLLTVQGNQKTSIEKDLTMTVSKNAGIDVTDAYSLTAKTIKLEAGDEITLLSGSARIVLKKDGNITIEGKTIQITGDGGDVIIKGNNVKLN